jgi:hypothetical protein
MDVACAVESVVPKLPHILGMEFRWKIRSMFQKPRSPPPNLNKKELSAVKSLRRNRNIKILQADKGNCTVVLDEVDYKNKLLDSEV